MEPFSNILLIVANDSAKKESRPSWSSGNINPTHWSVSALYSTLPTTLVASSAMLTMLGALYELLNH